MVGAGPFAGWYNVLIGESNVAIDPAIGGYGVADIYLGEFSPHGLRALGGLRLLRDCISCLCKSLQGVPLSHVQVL